jgi:hypothetical protein
VNKFDEEVRSVDGIDNWRVSDAQRKIPKPKSFEQDGGDREMHVDWFRLTFSY